MNNDTEIVVAMEGFDRDDDDDDEMNDEDDNDPVDLIIREMVDLIIREMIANKEDEALLKKLIQAHFDKTGRAVAKFILADFENQLKQFVKVFPSDYKEALAKQKSKLVATK